MVAPGSNAAQDEVFNAMILDLQLKGS